MSTRFKNRPGRGFHPIKSAKRHAAKVRAWKAERDRYGMTKVRRPDCAAACGWKTDGNGYAYEAVNEAIRVAEKAVRTDERETRAPLDPGQATIIRNLQHLAAAQRKEIAAAEQRGVAKALEWARNNFDPNDPQGFLKALREAKP